LLKDGGQQLTPEYGRLSPAGLVPTLIDHDTPLNQSLAIIEYLEETHPMPPLLPSAPLDRAHARAIALQIACEIHPLNNLRVLKYLKHTLKVSDEQKDAWYRHWIESGFAALETLLANDPRTGKLAIGDTPTLADLCIVPQVFNAQRFNIDIAPFPTIRRVFDNAMQLDAFSNAAPPAQPDAE
jgi:maleylpyruvate isomerase